MSSPTPEGITFSYNRIGMVGRPRLLFLHGFMGSKEDWTELTESLGEKVDALALDLPGHGMTEVTDDLVYPMPGCSEALVRFLDSQSFLPCHLVAYSMGGRLALHLLLNYPDKFSKAVLESASPGLRTEKERAVRIQLDQSRAHELNTASLTYFLTTWYAQPMFKGMRQDPERFEKLLQHKLSAEKNGWIKSLRYMGAGQQPPQWENLPGLTNPTCLIIGRNDGKFCGIAEEMKKCCERLELRTVPNSGHNVHFEQPSQFEECVRKFLEL
ncbi:MAG: 2-succinyl-6-hydroxy-2,4-cyclohexadiene-1-carboxylate synthase [bacterium]|nr:2-succinyl-6-hydroxy-2,4-cyclohexadiene-1-carboxylate synthase [bacterium]